MKMDRQLLLLMVGVLVLAATTQGITLSCTTDADCPPLSCGAPNCFVGGCIYPPVGCVLPYEDECMAILSCDASDDDGDEPCTMHRVDCDDGNPCTNDFCSRVSATAVECYNQPIEGCVPDISNCANISINDYSNLQVTLIDDSGIVQFCHRSTFYGEDTAVVLGFDPYQPCRLNERGICDNRPAELEAPESVCVTDAQTGSPLPCSNPGGYSFLLPGFGSSVFVWDDSTFQPQFIPDAGGPRTAHIYGYIKDSADATNTLHVDLWLADASTAGTPVKQFPNPCYLSAVQTSTWTYYYSLTGLLTATKTSPWNGLQIEVLTLITYPPQQGIGANNRNTDMGLSAGLQWLVVNQPYNNTLALPPPSLTGMMVVDLLSNCNYALDYCALFSEPQKFPANGWTVTNLNVLTGNITYCRNFTLDELLSCRSFEDPYWPLFTIIESADDDDDDDVAVEYQGKLYYTAVSPSLCNLWPESCGDNTIVSTCYNFTITISTEGEVGVGFITSDLDFDAIWLGNVWLCDDDAGNLKVKILTEFDQHGDSDMMLCNPTVDTSRETGYPLSFISPHTPPSCNNDGTVCYQEWYLRTYGAEDGTDFSGLKPLRWDVCDDGMVLAHVSADVYLSARHVGQQQHVNAQIDADLDLFVDPEFQIPYEFTRRTECSYLYGSLCLENFEYLDLFIRRVTICYSKDRDLDPFDPRYPESTGCNTEGDDVYQLVLFSIDDDDDSDDDRRHDFQLLWEPEHDDSCQLFQFKVLPLTRHIQSLQIEWFAEEDGSRGGRVEMMTEFMVDNNELRRSRGETKHEHASFVVERTVKQRGWMFNWGSSDDDDDSEACRSVDVDGDIAPRPPPPPPRDDDDDDEYREPEHDDHGGHHGREDDDDHRHGDDGYGGFFSEHYNDHGGHHHHDHDDDWGAWVAGIVFIIIIIIFICWCYHWIEGTYVPAETSFWASPAEAEPMYAQPPFDDPAPPSRRPIEFEPVPRPYYVSAKRD